MAAPSALKCVVKRGCAVLFRKGASVWKSQHSLQQHRCFFWRRQESSSYSVVKPAVVGPAHPVPQHIMKPDYVTTGIIPDWGDYIEIKDEDQIQGLRQACQLARHILLLAGRSVKVGMTTEEIDCIVHQETIRHNAYPSPLGYGGFPKSVCTSVNNVVCHGIPDSRPLQDGDIINIDVTVYLNGYHGDTSETFLVGNVDERGRVLVEAARRCRNDAIAACEPGAPLCIIGNTIRKGKALHSYSSILSSSAFMAVSKGHVSLLILSESQRANSYGLQVCPYFIGHGIGTYFHGHPEIWHHDRHRSKSLYRRSHRQKLFVVETKLVHLKTLIQSVKK
ncbi:methionine aminopeptidase 1D, mitochondrial isoform X2 [Lepisosteus oculatus]|uniref:methionine aminopeptidase 1D, mitochondrial isoform X2 n=1 Tax=Lepisosteus oculatus TaxID=7918 RepID=UPI00073FF2EC|nr:PREDICTED: methionine aminopeptidase 1D, mitochondrial isoform X2 [Lepisosteus oculatus]